MCLFVGSGDVPSDWLKRSLSSHRVPLPQELRLPPPPSSTLPLLRCSHGTHPRTKFAQTIARAGHTSAQSRRSSPTARRNAAVRPRKQWERRGWTSRTARWPTSATTAPRATALRGRWGHSHGCCWKTSQCSVSATACSFLDLTWTMPVTRIEDEAWEKIYFEVVVFFSFQQVAV